jgi:hypothetical protein
MELSISASCFFVESSMVDWELVVWDEFCLGVIVWYRIVDEEWGD